MKETRFKRTELGVIPEDWTLRAIGTIAKIVNGTTPSTEHPEYYGHEYPFVSPFDLGEKKYIEETNKYLSRIGFSITRQVPTNSIMYTCTGSTIGKLGIASKLMTTNQQINSILPNDGYSSEYLYYAIQTRKEDIRSRAAVQAIPLINKNNFSKTIVAFPPETTGEIERIANALSDVDDLISTLQKLIVKKRNIKQGAMQELLSEKRRLPGHVKEWVDTTLDSISDLYQPHTIPGNQFTDYGYNVYGANGIIGKYPDYNHETDQVLITCRGNTCGEINYSIGKCWINGNAMVVNMDKYNVDKKFIYYLLKAKDFSPVISGSGQPQITREPLRKFALRIPKDRKEQKAIAAVLTDMDNEIFLLEERLEKYKALKQGMMQQLLTGKIRLI